MNRDRIPAQKETGPQALAQKAQTDGREEELLSNAELHIAVDEWKKAVPILTELLQLAPEHPKYNTLLARALGKCSGLERHAERQFQRALQLAPEDPDVHYAFGEFYLSMGRKARADQQFQATLRLAPHHKRAQQELQRRRKSEGSLASMFKKMLG